MPSGVEGAALGAMLGVMAAAAEAAWHEAELMACGAQGEG